MKALAYRVYVTDALKSVGHLQGQRYLDFCLNMDKPQETRTGDEIIQDIKNGINNLNCGKED